MTRRATIASALCTLALLLAAAPACARSFNPNLYDQMRWRPIGPFRGGRTVAVSGVPSEPGIYYMAAVDGGVWKSTDYGRTWKPIFDGQDTGSIGALAVAPSNPNVIYAGSGEGLRRPDLSVGDGIYRSTDAGKTWTHLGLRDGQQINAIAVDPRDPNRLFAAVLGHPYGPNAQRGLYRSADGGKTWQKVLGHGVDTGAVTVVIDPRDPDVVYAALWASRNGPWHFMRVYEHYRAGGLYKSTDGGTTWTKLTRGLPLRVGRIGIAVAASPSARAGSPSQRLYAIVERPAGCGVYRSDDAGASWTQTDTERRVCGRTEDFAGITADPVDPNVVYSANTTTYRSTDGGKTWTGIKGAPGGDDYHTVWIDPDNRDIILLGSDQGATLSVNYGRTWSSWYNQPTAQFYHVIADDRFPYRVFGGQQESGSAEVRSRSDAGSITFRDFHPVGAEEYGYIAPDPLHPWIVYGGKVTRYNERTHQTQDVSPSYEPGAYRFDRTAPLIFNRVDPHVLYLGANVILETSDGGRRWKAISPDLTRKDPGEPRSMGTFAAIDPHAGRHRGVVYSIAPSYVDARLIWAGTDDGLVWVTRDGGKRWTNVTPKGLRPWSKIAQIDPSHFDRNTAYIAVNRFRVNDLHPYIYRTHDGGKSWQPIVNGLPADEPVNVVREDSKRKGLLFAGTERTVYVSFDDGAHWQSLQLNLPSTSVRDIVVHGGDLVAGTHGRAFWILDDIAPLRQIDARMARASAYLYTPERSYRIRRDVWTDTPLPPEEPAGTNPPAGAILDYYLGAAANGPLRIAVYDTRGRLVRSWSSADRPSPIDPEIDVPTYWVRPPQIPAATAGMHRFVWDLHYPAPDSVFHGYPIAATIHATPRIPQGVLAVPGRYTVALTVNGHTYRRPLLLVMDPRVRISQAQLERQFDLGSRIVAAMDRAYAARLGSINTRLGELLNVVEGADAAPTEQAKAAFAALESLLHRKGSR